MPAGAGIRQIISHWLADRAAGGEASGQVLARLEPIAPKVSRLLEEPEEDLIASYRFPPRALEQAAADEPARAGQQRDRPPHRRRRDLPK
jgi:hypothetical protein